jgi:hypothetical protein
MEVIMKKFIALALAICGLSAPLSADMNLMSSFEIYGTGNVAVFIGEHGSSTNRFSYKKSDEEYSKELNDAVTFFDKQMGFLDDVKKIEIANDAFLSIKDIEAFFSRFEKLRYLKIFNSNMDNESVDKELADKLIASKILVKKLELLELCNPFYTSEGTTLTDLLKSIREEFIYSDALILSGDPKIAEKIDLNKILSKKVGPSLIINKDS